MSDAHGVSPRPSQGGERRKKGSGTSNQKSREANRKQRASESQLRFGLCVMNTSENLAFFLDAVPRSESRPNVATGSARPMRPIMTARASSYCTAISAEPRK